MNKLAVENLAFNDRFVLPAGVQQGNAAPAGAAASLARVSAAVASMCANKLRRHLGLGEKLGAAQLRDFEHSQPAIDEDRLNGADSLLLTGFADSVSEDEVHITLEVRSDASYAANAQPLAKGKLVFHVCKAASVGNAAVERRVDSALRAAVLLGAQQQAMAAFTGSVGSAGITAHRTVRAFAAAAHGAPLIEH